MIKVREFTFDTPQQCADHFGLTVSYVRTALSKGRAEFIGIGTASKGYTKTYKKPRMQVSVRGKVYATVEDCAKSLGVKKSSVYSALARGKEDTLGLGLKGERKKRYGGGRSKPIKIGLAEFPSIAAASRALGCHPRWLESALRNGRDEQVYAKAMKLNIPKLPSNLQEHSPDLGE